jgi:hypothetical protein
VAAVNFFGHAAVADLQGACAAGALGAMLPDFAGMLGLRIEGVEDEVLARGVALHHVTDDVFHGAPAFLDLCTRAVDDLEAAGVGRGSARAVAHVGTELLLDGWLVESGHGTATYLAALQSAGDDGLERKVRWRGTGGAARLAWLVERLREHGLPHDYGEAAFVTERLERALHRRPRLRLAPEQLPLVERWAAAARPAVRACAADLLDHVRRGVECHPDLPT